MPAFPNDNDASIDGLLRVAMKSLDEHVPSGYFEGLPNRTLARLEGSSMQTTSSSSGGIELPMDAGASGPLEGVVKGRDEDSGLHDIRNLASSARMRISTRRAGTNPPAMDDDVLASSSGSWKAVALPEPAKMVSLPDLDSLPSKADIKALEKAEKAQQKIEQKIEKASRKSRPSGEMPMAASSVSSPSLPIAAASGSGLAVVSSTAVTEPPLHLDPTPIPALAKGTDKGATSSMAIGTAKGATSAAIPMIGSRIAGASGQKKSRGALYGVLGVSLAAAAGVVVYVQTQGGSTDAQERIAPSAEASKPALGASAPTAQPIATDPKKDEPKADPAPVVAAPEVVPDVPVDATKVAKPPKKGDKDKKPIGKTIIEVKDPGNGVAPVKKTPDKPVKEEKKDGEPDLNDLLKEGGYKDPKKDDKPKLEKKSLNGADFKAGMGSIAAKAQGCYKGTQGTATVKLVISPSGQVTRVTVSGVFVGTPVAACVESAVRGASFPPWDGGPQSFNYNYLLAE